MFFMMCPIAYPVQIGSHTNAIRECYKNTHEEILLIILIVSIPHCDINIDS